MASDCFFCRFSRLQQEGRVLAKLRKDEIVTLQVLKSKGESNESIVARLGVTEGAVLYHLRRS